VAEHEMVKASGCRKRAVIAKLEWRSTVLRVRLFLCCFFSDGCTPRGPGCILVMIRKDKHGEHEECEERNEREREREREFIRSYFGVQRHGEYAPSSELPPAIQNLGTTSCRSAVQHGHSPWEPCRVEAQ
jgi:hypothetical protein